MTTPEEMANTIRGASGFEDRGAPLFLTYDSLKLKKMQKIMDKV